MPSPFPGMDPFIEGHAWEDFHHHIVEELHAALVPRVRPRYIVRVEQRVYLERDLDTLTHVVRPDVTLMDRSEGLASLGARPSTAVAAPAIVTLPMAELRHQAYLSVRERDTMAVVTVMEVLSPSNKHPGSDGRREYLAKREQVLQSATHLVELDLLRGGERLPTIEELPPGDYYAFVCRAQRRPRAEVYAWGLQSPLPDIPVPLADEDPDVTLSLGTIFSAAYDRAGYDYSLDYRRSLDPPLSDADRAWAAHLLASRPRS